MSAERHCVANDMIFLESEHALSVYLLTTGIVRRHKTLRDGRRQILGFAVPGDFIVLPQSDRKPFSADAIGNVTVNKISRASFLTFMRLSPALLRLVLEFTSRELYIAQNQVVLLGRATPTERLLSFLLMWRDRFTQSETGSTEIILPMKRSDIADYLGMTVETVSRTLTKLQRDKLIVLNRDRVTLLDSAQVAMLATTQRPS
jgi:CRP/FNR family transcriptional regulator